VERSKKNAFFERGDFGRPTSPKKIAFFGAKRGALAPPLRLHPSLQTNLFFELLKNWSEAKKKLFFERSRIF
jgi:hypothetical protein